MSYEEGVIELLHKNKILDSSLILTKLPTWTLVTAHSED